MADDKKYIKVGNETLAFPSNMSDADIQSVLEEQFPKQAAPSGFIQGLMDPVYGAGQLVGKALEQVPEGVSIMGIPVAKAAQAFSEKVVPQREQQYQTAREASGQDGFDWARVGGNIVSPANLVAGGAAGSLARNVGAQAALAGAAQGVVSPVAATEDFGAEKAKQTAGGAFFGMLGSGATKAIGGALNPLVSKAEETMKNLGVTMTPGQLMGGKARDLEDFAMSMPLIGPYISGARERTLFSFNKGVINKALGKVDEKLPADVIGRDAVQHANDVIDKAYDDVLNQMSFKLDFPTYSNVLKSIKTPPSTEQRVKVKEVLDTYLFNKLPKDGKLDGQAYKAIESDLRTKATGYKSSGTEDQREIGYALDDALNALKEGLKKQNPDQTSQLRRVDSAYGDIAVMRTAAANAGAENGVFTPKQYQTAVRQRDMSRNKGRFAAGLARGQDVSDAAVSVLGTSPKATLEGRLAVQAAGLMGALQNPAVAGGIAVTAPVMYSESGINAMNALMRSRPEIARQLGDVLVKRASKEGSITGAQVLQEYNRMTQTKDEIPRIELRGMANPQ